MCGSSIHATWATARSRDSDCLSCLGAEGLENCLHNCIIRTGVAAERFRQLLCGHLSNDVRVFILAKGFEEDLQAGVYAELAVNKIQGKVSHHLQPIKLRYLKALSPGQGADC